MAKKTSAKKDWQELPEKTGAYERFLDFLNRRQNTIFAVVVVVLLCIVGMILLRRHYVQKAAEVRAAVDGAKTAADLETLLRENEGSSMEPFIRYRLAGAYLEEGKQKEALAEHRTLQDRWGGKSIYAQFATDASSRISRNLAFKDEVLPARLKELDAQHPEPIGPPAPEPEGPQASAHAPAEESKSAGAVGAETEEGKTTPAGQK